MLFAVAACSDLLNSSNLIRGGHVKVVLLSAVLFGALSLILLGLLKRKYYLKDEIAQHGGSNIPDLDDLLSRARAGAPAGKVGAIALGALSIAFEFVAAFAVVYSLTAGLVYLVTILLK